MLYNRRACGCGGGMMGQYPMMGQNPMMGQSPMMDMDDYDGKMGCGCGPCANDPIMEAPIEKCIKRDICHEVRHLCPIHTKVINNHIYHHTYAPCYSCSEENVVTNLDQGSCCNFM